MAAVVQEASSLREKSERQEEEATAVRQQLQASQDALQNLHAELKSCREELKKQVWIHTISLPTDYSLKETTKYGRGAKQT